MNTDVADGDALLREAVNEAPGTVELARWVSLATRIEPYLLRRARLRLAPHLDAGVESDLWFGPLVDSRSAAAVVLHRGVATILREALVKDTGRLADGRQPLDAARAVVEAAHAHVAPAIQLEEEIIYRTLRDGADAAGVTAAIDRALSAMRRDDKSGVAVARWADRALLGMPATVRRLESARQLASGTITRLGTRTRLLREIDDVRLPADASWVAAYASSTPVAIGVRLGAMALRFVDAGTDLSATIRVPDTKPRLVEVAWTEASGSRNGRAVAATVGATVPLPAGAKDVVLRTVSGAEYALHAESLASTSPPLHAPQGSGRYRVAAVAVINDARPDLVQTTDGNSWSTRASMRRANIFEDTDDNRELHVRRPANWPLSFLLRGASGAVVLGDPLTREELEARLHIPVVVVPAAKWNEAEVSSAAQSLFDRVEWSDERSIADKAQYEEVVPLLPGDKPRLPGITPSFGVRIPFGDLAPMIQNRTPPDTKPPTDSEAGDLAARVVAIAEAQGLVWHVAQERGDDSSIVAAKAVGQALDALTNAVAERPWRVGLAAIEAATAEERASSAFATAEYDVSELSALQLLIMPEVLRAVMTDLIDEFSRLGWVRRVALGDVSLLHFPELFQPSREIPIESSASMVTQRTWSADAPPVDYQDLLLHLAAAGVQIVQVGPAVAQLASGNTPWWIRFSVAARTVELLVPPGIGSSAESTVLQAFDGALGGAADAVGAVLTAAARRLTESPQSTSPLEEVTSIFVSIASADDTRELREFMKELAEEVRARVGHEVRLEGFGFSSSVGTDVRQDIERAIFSSQIFIAVVTDQYLANDWCGRELAAFDSRLHTGVVQPDARLVLPIFWRGVPRRPLPPVLANLHALQAGRFGVEVQDGFLEVLRTGRRDVVREIVSSLGRDIADTVKRDPLPVAAVYLSLLDFPNPFADSDTAPSLDWNVVLKILQSLALAFHVHKLDGDAKDDTDRWQRYELHTQQERDDFSHVVMQTEYLFSGPVAEYLVAGGADPFTLDDDAAIDTLRQALPPTHDLRNLLEQFEQHATNDERKIVEAKLEGTIEGAIALIGTVASGEPGEQARYDDLRARLSDDTLGRLIGKYGAARYRWYRNRPTSLASSDSFPAYVERLTSLWLRYTDLSTRRLGETWIGMVDLPLSVLDAFRARFGDIAIQVGEQMRSMFRPANEEPGYAWSIRADAYRDAVSRLLEPLLPALYDEMRRREQSAAPRSDFR